MARSSRRPVRACRPQLIRQSHSAADGEDSFPTSRGTSRRTPHQRRRSECAGKPRLQQRRQACSKSFRTSVAMVEQFTPKGGEHFLDAPATEPEIDNPAQIGRDTHAFLVDEYDPDRALDDPEKSQFHASRSHERAPCLRLPGRLPSSRSRRASSDSQRNSVSDHRPSFIVSCSSSTVESRSSFWRNI